MIPRLPEPPSAAEVTRHVPTIAPVPEGEARPFWSVMIPAYNCDGYLRRTLASVLRQDPGPAAMQIEVIDDRSTQGDPEAVVREVGGGRVDFHRNPANLGATATFNVCLERSRGRWVHVLHGDDAVLPGFYDAYAATIEANPSAVMVVGKCVTIDEDDQWTSLLGPDMPENSAILADFCCEQAVAQVGQFASWVTRRDVLERVGGFCTLFSHAADMDLAFRIGLAGPVACVAQAYGLYRVHRKADTRRLMISGENIRERAQVTRLNLSRLPPDACAENRRVWRRYLARTAHRAAWALSAAGSLEGRVAQASWAMALEPGPARAWFLAKSWLKLRLAQHRGAGRQGN